MALDDVAKEAGLTQMLKGNVIVVVGTSDLGPAARHSANQVMTDSNLCVVLLDGRDVRLIEKKPTATADIFNREAAHAMKLKALDRSPFVSRRRRGETRRQPGNQECRSHR